MANKNSTYVQSLVSFILDTKPYHSKLTEIVEEYRFSDSMTVNIKENLFSRNSSKSAWVYDLYSDGISTPAPLTQIHRIVSPEFRQFTVNENSTETRGAFKVSRDENTDLPLVPLAFDPTNIQGLGLSDAFVQRGGLGTLNEGLLEGKDLFLSKGAYVFQIKQTISAIPKVLGEFTQEYTADQTFPIPVTLSFTTDTLVIQGPAVQVTSNSISVTAPGMVTVTGLSNNPNYVPEFTERGVDGVMAAASTAVQAFAIDKTNPASAISLIQVVLNMIEGQMTLYGTPTVQASLDAVQAIVTAGDLPSTYEQLISDLKTANVPVPPDTYFNVGAGRTQWVQTWDDVQSVLESYSPNLYFNMYTDIGAREDGALVYDDVLRSDVSITSISSDNTRADYEEWTLTAEGSSTLLISGSVSGIIGEVSVPGSFTSPFVNFTTAAGTSTLASGTQILLTPRAKITIHQDAALESWSIIKTNPMAYSRPLFESGRYGYVQDGIGTKNYITILDTTFPSSTVVLTATNSTTFSVTCTADGSYYGTATVGTQFNDGRLQFTIVAGTEYTFQANDKFFIEIYNAPANADSLDLYYGYDLSPYDGDTYVYNTINAALADYQRTLDFSWDSRFTSYDLASFNLQLTQNAVGNRQWRLRAIPDYLSPLEMQTVSPGQVNELQPDDALNPNASTQFDMPNDVTSEGVQSSSDPDILPDLKLWYSSSFALEYFDETIHAWVTVGTVPVGGSYSSATHGISFTLVPASKPFIAAELTTSYYDSSTSPVLKTDTVNGGDTIYWIVQNNAPVQTEPAGVESVRIPRMALHGDSYFYSTPAKWYITFSSDSAYELQGFYTTGLSNGLPVSGTPLTIQLADGLSYLNSDFGLNWSLKVGSGFKAGDRFTFETYASKPFFMVYGSVSGWQPDANINEYYWNGKIGFKITNPEVHLFIGNSLISDWSSSIYGSVALEYLRPDISAAVYIAHAHNDGYWTLYRDGQIVGNGTSLIGDKYFQLSMPTAVAGATATFQVYEGMPFKLGNDLAIVRTTAGRAPSTSDFMLFARTRQDDIGISIIAKDPDQAAVLAALGPTNIDLRYVDLTAGSGVPLSVTSPETAILSGWIPTTFTAMDSSTSNAEFDDMATRFVVQSTITGETVGTVRPIDTDLDTVTFEWDSTFAAKYLPINTEAAIVTYSSGMNEPVRVNFGENVQFLIDGGALSESALFREAVNIGIVESNLFQINMTQDGVIDVHMADGPFGGFLPGYDNTPYDLEDNVDGYFDAGQAFTNVFQRARELALQNVLSPEEQALYNDLLGLLGPYISDPATMTIAQFMALLDNDPPVNYTPQYFGFGVPALGMASEVTDSSAESIGSSVKEALTILTVDNGNPFDYSGFGAGYMDAFPESFSTLISTDAPPIPSAGIPLSGTFDSFDSPLYVPISGLTIDVSFSTAIPGPGTPQFYIWTPADTSARAIPVVERVSSNVFRFNLAAPTSFKLGVTW